MKPRLTGYIVLNYLSPDLQIFQAVIPTQIIEQLTFIENSYPNVALESVLTLKWKIAHI